MAKSPAHRFGQIIGDLLEETMINYCKPLANEQNFYLDYKHSREARNGNNEVKWADINGNIHKLDIVIEENGSETNLGVPRAFIEMAWRRYTKHSKNKAQEITAAIKPLVDRYSERSPFYGAVLAGEFTQNSINQMKSEGFEVLYFSIDTIENAFATQGIDAHWDEYTSEDDLQSRVNQAEALTTDQLRAIGKHLIDNNNQQWTDFQTSIKSALERSIERIVITSLYGETSFFNRMNEACEFIEKEEYTREFNEENFYGYEIHIMYSNGDKIDMQFKDKRTVLSKLRQFL